MSKPAQEFWTWFEKNHHPYLFLKDIDPAEKERLMQALLIQLHRYCDELYFDIAGRLEGPHELIISAGGQKALFDRVEALVAAAPKLKDWSFSAFIPGKTEPFWMRFDGVVFKTEEILVIPYEYPLNLSLIGMQVCLKNYEEVKDLDFILQAVCKLLEMVIGERAFAQDIDQVEIGPIPDPGEGGTIELLELPGYIASRKKMYPRVPN